MLPKGKFTRQPQRAAGVDWSDPITRQLTFAMLPAHHIGASGGRDATGRWSSSSTWVDPGPMQGNARAMNFIMANSGANGIRVDKLPLTTAGPVVTIMMLIAGTKAPQSSYPTIAPGEYGFDFVLMSAGSATGTAGGFTFRISPSGTLSTQIKDAGNTDVCNFNGTTVVTDGKPHLVALELDQGSGKVCRLWVDGRIDASNTTSGPWSWSSAINWLVLGRAEDSFWGFYQGNVGMAALFARRLTLSEHQALRRNPWRLFSKGRVAQQIHVELLGWLVDVSAAGWASTAATLADAIDESSSANDADFVTSPILQGTTTPGLFSLTTPKTAGQYGMSVRANTSAHGRLRLNFLDAGSASVGATVWVQLTTTLTTYTLYAILTGTATQVKIEVDNT